MKRIFGVLTLILILLMSLSVGASGKDAIPMRRSLQKKGVFGRLKDRVNRHFDNRKAQNNAKQKWKAEGKEKTRLEVAKKLGKKRSANKAEQKRVGEKITAAEASLAKVPEGGHYNGDRAKERIAKKVEITSLKRQQKDLQKQGDKLSRQKGVGRDSKKGAFGRLKDRVNAHLDRRKAQKEEKENWKVDGRHKARLKVGEKLGKQRRANESDQAKKAEEIAAAEASLAKLPKGGHYKGENAQKRIAKEVEIATLKREQKDLQKQGDKLKKKAEQNEENRTKLVAKNERLAVSHEKLVDNTNLSKKKKQTMKDGLSVLGEAEQGKVVKGIKVVQNHPDVRHMTKKEKKEAVAEMDTITKRYSDQKAQYEKEQKAARKDADEESSSSESDHPASSKSKFKDLEEGSSSSSSSHSDSSSGSDSEYQGSRSSSSDEDQPEKPQKMDTYTKMMLLGQLKELVDQIKQSQTPQGQAQYQ